MQFADDSILLEKGTSNNLWSLKTIFRGFELVSGVCMNFHKSKLLGINLHEDFLDAASVFLSFHNSIPLYFFLFFKAPKLVLKELIRYKGIFFWGSKNDDDKKICWVAWENVCIPKKEGGLRIKKLELFNISLLAKLKWRFLLDRSKVVWRDN